MKKKTKEKLVLKLWVTAYDGGLKQVKIPFNYRKSFIETFGTLEIPTEGKVADWLLECAYQINVAQTLRNN